MGCGSQAIAATGSIHQRECLLCLDCMVMYDDEHACLLLSKERKAREKAGQPLTKVGADGYYIPIHPVAAAAPAPAASQPTGILAWLTREAIDHLFPWTREGVKNRNVAIKALAAAATMLMTGLLAAGCGRQAGHGHHPRLVAGMERL